LKTAREAGVNVGDIARAAASMEGKLAAFDEGRDDLGAGLFAHYVNYAEELIQCATTCARERQRGQ
jgi:hypothetical protein